MNRKWFGVAALTAIASLLLSFSGCARNQHLVSITLEPANGFVFEGFGAQGQFRAIGTYEHPPASKDITNQVVWSLNISNFADLTQTGQITYTRTDGCGSGEVLATFNDNPKNPSAGNVIIGTAPVKGVNDGTSKCQSGGSSQPVLTLTFSGSGSGSVSSSPSGLTCSSPSPCLAQFASGTAVTLTAMPTSPSVFGSWVGCDSSGTTNPCTLTLTANRTVTVTFN